MKRCLANLRVRVTTPARLHFGLIDLRGDLGRKFGGIGLAIDKPNVVVEAMSSDNLRISGRELKRAQQAVETICEHYEVEPKVAVRVLRAIPKHVGLGSTTQLLLGVGKAVAGVLGIGASTWRLARILGRGRVSSIGIAAFEQGGFILDGGVGETTSIPPLIARFKFPEDWALVVAIPKARAKFDERRERRAFASLRPMDEGTAAKICRLILVKMLPALVERDIRSFGEALTQVQVLVGDYFAPVQGGRYSNPVSARCAEIMLRKGAYGVGQSSWGPAVYGLTLLEDSEDLKREVEGELDRMGGGQAFVALPNNKGASVDLS